MPLENFGQSVETNERSIPNEYKPTIARIKRAEKLAKKLAIGLETESTETYLKLVLSYGHNKEQFLPIQEHQLAEIRRHFPYFKLTAADLTYKGSSEFMKKRAQIHTLTAGILYWSICKNLFANRLSHRWSAKNKNKITALAYQVGTGEFTRFWVKFGPFSDFNDLSRKARQHSTELMTALLRVNSIFGKSMEVPTPPRPRKPEINFPEFTPKPAPRSNENLETMRHKETVAWNKKAIPTYDDGPDLQPNGRISNITTEIMKASYEKGVNNLEFYWLGANLLNKEAWKKMKLVTKHAVPRTSSIKPGHWMEWVDRNKPSNMTRQEYIQTLLHPDAKRLCRQIKALLPPGQDLSDLIGYHGITHEASSLRKGRHVISLKPSEIRQEIEFFQEIIRAAFDEPNYLVKKGRTPYGSGLKFNIPNPAMRYSRYNPKLVRAAKQINPDFQWKAWSNDSEDWEVNGRIDTKKMAAESANRVQNGEKHYILMHERYYKNGKIKYIKQLHDSISEKTNPENSETVETKLQLELGRWTKPRVNALLEKAQQIDDPNKRMTYIMQRFLRTPFKYESQMPIPDKDTLRVRLKTFDCITFAYYMMALSSSKDFNEFVENLKKIRYKNPEQGLDSDPDQGNIFDFGYNSLYENAIRNGLLKDVTREVGGSAVTRITTRLKAINRDRKHDNSRQVVRPKLNEGQRVSAYTIDKTKYSEIDTSKIKDGDVILFTRASNKITVVTHVAIAKKVGSRVHFIHASKKPGVSLKRKPLDQYLNGINRFKGFMVLRPQNPSTYNEGNTLEKMAAQKNPIQKKVEANKTQPTKTANTPEAIAYNKSKDDNLAEARKNHPKYFQPEVNKNFQKLRPQVAKAAADFYKNLGLNAKYISRSAKNFLELAIRRELSINDWKDGVQEFWTKHVSVLPNSSIGPLEIRPATYVEALMKKNGLKPSEDYDKNVETLIKNEVIIAANQIWYRLVSPSKALQAYQDVLAMYLPKNGSSIPILINKNGKLKEYKIPKQETYAMSNKEGHPITYTYDEMRLMCGVAKYQGVGLRFLSPDKDVKIAQNDQVIVEKSLVLNNVVSEICSA